MKNAEIREIVDAAIRRYKSQARSYGYDTPEVFLEQEIFQNTGAWTDVGLVERPTIKAMMAAAKAAIRPSK
jgi:hypothetical protein